jgi:O-antigen biosynthesis protein
MADWVLISFKDVEQFEGSLDELEGARVRGWARAIGDTAPIIVEVRVDGEQIFGGVADAIRAVGSGAETGNYGFEAELPNKFLDGEWHEISATIGGTDRHLTNSPRRARLGATEHGTWQLQGLKITGWIAASNDGEREIEVITDGEIEATISVLAKAQAAVEFLHWLPWRLVDGHRHEIRLRLVGSHGLLLRTTIGHDRAEFAQTIRSTIDRFVDGVITGWAYDVTAPDDLIDIALYDGARRVGQTATVETRADVNRHFGISGTHGFSIAVPHSLFDGRDHDLRLVARDTLLHSPFDIALPKTLSPEMIGLLQHRAGADGDRFVGRVEEVNCAKLVGWAADRAKPYHPVRVAVLVDGKVEAVAEANAFQKRFERITVSGYHGFRVDLPSHLMDGTTRQIEVRLLENDVALPGEQGAQTCFSVFFPLIDFFSLSASGRREATLPILPKRTLQLPSSNAVEDRNRPDVSVIVLNWNGAHLLTPFLQSLRDCLPLDRMEVLLVDHGSSDGSLSVAESSKGLLNLTILPRNQNHSFSDSNNFAARRASGDYLLFVNNDLVFTHDCVSRLVDWLDADPSVGVVGTRLTEPLPKNGAWDFVTHHRGIQFESRSITGDKGRLAYFPVEAYDSAAELGLTFDVPATTAALFMCRKEDFLALGGFDEDYFYGLEDVDFCLRMRRDLGKIVLCDTSVTALHNRSSTRLSRGSMQTSPVGADPNTQIRNGEIYLERFGAYVRRRSLQALIAGDNFWRNKALRVAFAVTDASPTTTVGDFFTAMELGAVLRARFGWEVLFVRNGVTKLPGVDVLVAMRHDFNLVQIAEANPGLITVAWIRNRVDQWLALQHMDSYNLIFCSSQIACSQISSELGRSAEWLPIAANEERFCPREAAEGKALDVIFTGNYWGQAREAIDQIDLGRLKGTFAIFGAGWDGHERWARHWRGVLRYDELATAYASAKIVIDDSHPVTRDWHSLNARVFDALAAGTLVLTNCAGGSRELFEGRLPTFSNARELNDLLAFYLTNDQARQSLAQQLRQTVIERHTYAHRAAVVKSWLAKVASAVRIAIKIGVPNQKEKLQWGDWYFANGLKRALEAKGCLVRVDILPDWDTGISVGDDVTLVLRGLSQYRPRPGVLNLMWLLSHPDETAAAELDAYDHIFVASIPFARKLSTTLGARVSALLQCTDPEVFRPQPDPDLIGLPTALFVGNSRKVRRKIIDDAVSAGIDFGIYGRDWDGLVPDFRVLGNFIANDQLSRYYSSAKIVLNDHWPDMRREGFLSNRLFDAGACGAAVITDDALGVRDVFGDAVGVYMSPTELKREVRDLADQADLRHAMGTQLRRLVLENHTFAHRAAAIMKVIEGTLHTTGRAERTKSG